MKMVLIFNAHTYFHHSVTQHKNRNIINKAHLEHNSGKSCILNLTVDIHVISYHAVLAKCVYLKILETKIFSVFMSDRFWVPSIRWHTMFWYLAATFVFKQLYTSFKLTCGIVGLQRNLMLCREERVLSFVFFSLANQCFFQRQQGVMRFSDSLTGFCNRMSFYFKISINKSNKNK